MKFKKFLAAALAAVMAAMLSGCGTTSINLNEYIILTFTGYDTVGKASAKVDIDALLEDYAETLKIDKENDPFSALAVYGDFYDKIDGELDERSGLSNGDKIKFVWDEIDVKHFAEKYSVSLNFSDMEFTVGDLDKANLFDPFDDLTVTYEGFAPYGRLVIRNARSGAVTVNFEADRTDGLSNGDAVVIKATAGGDLTSYCLDRGYIPTETEKTFTVSGLASYAASLDEIPADSYDKMNAHALDTFHANVAKDWGDGESLKNIALIGNYFLTPKDASLSADKGNIVYFIYKVTAENVDSEGEFDYYYYSRFDDILLLEDGTCSFDLSAMSYPKTGWFAEEQFYVGSRYHYGGYQDIDTLFNKLVTSKIDRYAYVSTVSE